MEKPEAIGWSHLYPSWRLVRFGIHFLALLIYTIPICYGLRVDCLYTNDITILSLNDFRSVSLFLDTVLNPKPTSSL
jgi:hypothetical protein